MENEKNQIQQTFNCATNGFLSHRKGYGAITFLFNRLERLPRSSEVRPNFIEVNKDLENKETKAQNK